MRLNEFTEQSIEEEGVGEGVATGLASAFTGGMLGGVAGVALGSMGALFAPWGSKMATFQGVVSLSAALGAWMLHKHVDDLHKYDSQSIFDVFVNGKKLTNNPLDRAAAANLIAKAAEKEHDPNTFYTIVDNKQNKIVWRFKIGDEESVEEGTGRDSWDSNMPGYQGDYGGAENWGRRNREDDEHHEIDRRMEKEREHRNTHGTWYVRIDGIIEPTPYTGKAAANAAALELKKQPGNENKLFMLTTKA